MKPNVVNILKICGITLLLLSPAFGVLTIVWHHHTAFIQTQEAIAYGVNSVSNPALAGSGLTSSALLSESCSTAFYRPTFRSVMSQLQAIIHTILGIGVLAGFGYALGIALYKQYRGYRVAVIREQVERLERLWQQEHC